MINFINYLIESNHSNKNTQSLEPLDETEVIHLLINDELLNNSKIAAYNIGQTIKSIHSNKEIPVNPKKFPTKAVDIVFPVQDLLVEVFFDTNQKKWDSDIIFYNKHVKLSPDQMEMFFQSNFYTKLLNKFQKEWPLSDKFYNELYTGLCRKELKIYEEPLVDEANDKEFSNKDIDDDGMRDYTASGRKIITFSDANVSSKGAKFFCWPNKKKAYRWSAWKDWKKIKPLCRMSFIYNDIPYGLSLSTLGDEKSYKLRGFRGYSLDPTLPPVQWLTKEENESLLKLSIVEKFIKHCINKITEYISQKPEEIYKKINAPDKIELNEIIKTQQCIRNTLNEVIKLRKIDTFRWN